MSDEMPTVDDWRAARALVFDRLKRQDRDIATVLQEVRAIDLKLGQDKVHGEHRTAADGKRDDEIGKLRHRLNNVEQALKGIAADREAEDKAEKRTLRRTLLGLLGAGGAGAGTLYGLLQAFGG